MGIARLLPLAIIASGALLVACDNGDDTRDEVICIDICETPAYHTPVPTSAEEANSTPESAACTTNEATPGDTDGSLISGGLDRTYLLHLPTQYDGRTPVPLVINLHGHGSSALEQLAYSRFNALADRESFVAVTPDGAGAPLQWTFPGQGTVDDIAFIGELIDSLASTHCIDESRVYVTGMSNGAGMSTYIACGLSGRIAAIGTVAATAGPQTCGNDVTVPVITFRGTEDACVPYGGGTTACGLMVPVVAAEEAVRLWGDKTAVILYQRASK